MTYLTVLSQNAENLRQFLKPLLFVVLWRIERSGVDGTAKVLMKGFGDKVHVPLRHSINK